jgi:hypothetical protein
MDSCFANLMAKREGSAQWLLTTWYLWYCNRFIEDVTGQPQHPQTQKPPNTSSPHWDMMWIP